MAAVGMANAVANHPDAVDEEMTILEQILDLFEGFAG